MCMDLALHIGKCMVKLIQWSAANFMSMADMQ